MRGCLLSVLLLITAWPFMAVAGVYEDVTKLDAFFDRIEKRDKRMAMCTIKPKELLVVLRDRPDLVSWIPEDIVRIVGDDSLENDEAFTFSLRKDNLELIVTLRTERNQLIEDNGMEWDEKYGFVYRGYKTITNDQYDRFDEAVSWYDGSHPDLPLSPVLKNN